MNQQQTRNLKLMSFAVLSLCFCSLMVFFAQQNKPLSLAEKALKRADLHAKNLIDTKFIIETEQPNSINNRGLASAETSFRQEALEGPVGLDPWGRPFKYLVKKDSKNYGHGELIIWSGGADGDFQTQRDSIVSGQRFEGDDFGKTYKF